MDLRKFALAVISLSLGLVLVLAIVDRSSAQTPAAATNMPTVGRYQMAPWMSPTAPSNLYMIDTATGECWEKSSKNAVWMKFAPPI